MVGTTSNSNRILVGRLVLICFDANCNSNSDGDEDYDTDDPDPDRQPPSTRLCLGKPRTVACAVAFSFSLVCNHTEPPPEIIALASCPSFFAGARTDKECVL